MTTIVIALCANLVFLVVNGWFSTPSQEEIKNLHQTTEETKEKPYHEWELPEFRAHLQAWWFKDQIATWVKQEQEQIDYDFQKSGRELFWEEDDEVIGEFTVTHGGIEDISLRRPLDDDLEEGARPNNRPFVYGLVGTKDNPFPPNGLVKLARQDNLETNSRVVVYQKKKGGLRYALPLMSSEGNKLASR